MQLLHITALLAFLCATSLHAGVKRNKDFDKIMPSTLKHPPETEARLDKWFRDSKFGAFIHFGAYSPLAGTSIRCTISHPCAILAVMPGHRLDF